MDTGLEIRSLELILAVAFGAAAWLFKGKLEEMERKTTALIHKIFEQGERMASLEAKTEALQRQIDRQMASGP